MLKVKFQLFFLLLVFTTFNLAKAQDDCTVKLNQAEKYYEEGKIEKVPDLIDNCIVSGFNNENRVAALRLLTLVYLFEDNQEKAEETLLRMLKIDPEYKINSAVDPVEFIKLFNSYETQSVFSLGIVGGLNFTYTHLIMAYPVYDYKSANPVYTPGGAGFSIGIKTNYHINQLIDIAFEPSFTINKFHLVENVAPFAQDIVDESITYLDFPVYGSYSFYSFNNYSFRGEVGFQYSSMISGTLSPTYIYLDNLGTNRPGPGVTTKEIRKPYNLMGSIGVGTKYKIKRGNIQVAVRYKIGFMNIVNESMRYKNYGNLRSDYSYQDNNISLTNLNIMVSYNREFYIHRKKSK